jgi:hypothetical protein
MFSSSAYDQSQPSPVVHGCSAPSSGEWKGGCVPVNTQTLKSVEVE